MNFAAINSLGASAGSDDPRAKAAEVAGKFEEIFARQMVETFRKASVDGEGGGMFGDAPGSSTYSSWFDEHMAHHLSSNGRIGISDTLMSYFERIKAIPTEGETEGGQLDATV